LSRFSDDYRFQSPIGFPMRFGRKLDPAVDALMKAVPLAMP
jgi:hypothetical protein